jgi:hypothetical protein
MNIILVGEESAGIHALQRMAESGHRIVGGGCFTQARVR